MGEFFTDFFSYFKSGGPLMTPLALLAFYLYYVCFDLFFRLVKINSLCNNPEKIFCEIVQDTNNCSTDKTSERLSIKKDFDTIRLFIMPAIRRTIKTIGVLASIAPLIGLLGTVSGMTLAISTMGEISGNITEGVSRALITTQCGLLIAIPAMVLRLMCSRLSSRILVKISRYETKLIVGRFAK